MPDGEDLEIPSYEEREDMINRLSEIIEHLQKTSPRKTYFAVLSELNRVNDYQPDPDDTNDEYAIEKIALAASCSWFFMALFERTGHVSDTIKHINKVSSVELHGAAVTSLTNLRDELEHAPAEELASILSEAVFVISFVHDVFHALPWVDKELHFFFEDAVKNSK